MPYKLCYLPHDERELNSKLIDARTERYQNDENGEDVTGKRPTGHYRLIHEVSDFAILLCIEKDMCLYPVDILSNMLKYKTKKTQTKQNPNLHVCSVVGIGLIIIMNYMPRNQVICRNFK